MVSRMPKCSSEGPRGPPRSTVMIAGLSPFSKSATLVPSPFSWSLSECPLRPSQSSSDQRSAPSTRFAPCVVDERSPSGPHPDPWHLRMLTSYGRSDKLGGRPWPMAQQWNGPQTLPGGGVPLRDTGVTPNAPRNQCGAGTPGQSSEAPSGRAAHTTAGKAILSNWELMGPEQ